MPRRQSPRHRAVVVTAVLLGGAVGLSGCGGTPVPQHVGPVVLSEAESVEGVDAGAAPVPAPAPAPAGSDHQDDGHADD